MSIFAAVRELALQDSSVLALLGEPRHWYSRQAPVSDHALRVVVQFVSGTAVQDHSGLDGLRQARLQVDVWAEGVGADEKVEALGRAVQRALVDRCRGGVLAAGMRVQSAVLVEDSERYEVDADIEELTVDDDPPVRFGFDVVISFEGGQ